MPRADFIEKISIHYIIPHFRGKYKPKNGGGEKNLKKIRSYPLRLAILIPGGMLAGFINGFLGTGGGILLVFLLGLVLPDGEDKDNAARDRFATVIAVIIPLSLVSAMIYSDSVSPTLSGVGQLEAQGINLVYFLFSSGAAMLVHMTRRKLNLPLIVVLALSGVVGAVCGSLLARSVDPMILRKTFGVLLFVSGTLALTAK